MEESTLAGLTESQHKGEGSVDRSDDRSFTEI